MKKVISKNIKLMDEPTPHPYYNTSYKDANHKFMDGKEIKLKFYEKYDKHIPSELVDKGWEPIEDHKYEVWWSHTDPADPADPGYAFIEYIEEIDTIVKDIKTIYISLPIAFQEDTVYQRNNDAKVYIRDHFRKYECVSPIDTNHIDDEALGNHLAIEKTAYYMGKDIEQVILCDAILMCPGWENSKGCKVEKFTAETYGKEVLYMK